ncbi:MAG: flagellar hook-length control protein FliK [Methylocapsa sp.]|nr:flagellar hook-length control protein FliK [Methylocapsa sp.]
MQILRLQLDPENLGNVTVKMRLAGAKLDLHIEAEKPETARLIGTDKEFLAARLRSEGYAIDSITIASPPPGSLPGICGGASTKENFPGYHDGGANAHGQHSMAEDNPRPHPEETGGDGNDFADIRIAADELIL